jgi:hypothetical protein
MNPTFRSPNPGNAIDGMPLVPRYAGEEEARANWWVALVCHVVHEKLRRTMLLRWRKRRGQ